MIERFSSFLRPNFVVLSLGLNDCVKDRLKDALFLQVSNLSFCIDLTDGATVLSQSWSMHERFHIEMPFAPYNTAILDAELLVNYSKAAQLQYTMQHWTVLIISPATSRLSSLTYIKQRKVNWPSSRSAVSASSNCVNQCLSLTTGIYSSRCQHCITVKSVNWDALN